MSKTAIKYSLYDGRYLANPDRAVCFEVCDTIKEARGSKREYGDDTVIVKETGTFEGKTFTVTEKEIVK